MELEERLLVAEPKFKAFNLLPMFDDEHLNVTFDAYHADILGNRDEFRAEKHSSLKWNLTTIKRATVCDTIENTNKHLYPCVDRSPHYPCLHYYC
jgi:hypothetical protein